MTVSNGVLRRIAVGVGTAGLVGGLMLTGAPAQASTTLTVGGHCGTNDPIASCYADASGGVAPYTFEWLWHGQHWDTGSEINFNCRGVFSGEMTIIARDAAGNTGTGGAWFGCRS